MMGGGGQKETGSTKTELPSWIKDRYGDIFSKEDDLYDMAMNVAQNQGPQQILGPNAMEYASLDQLMSGLGGAQNLLGSAADMSGYDSALSGLGSMVDKYQGFDTSGYGNLASQDRFGQLGEMGDYWNLGNLGGDIYGALAGEAGDLQAQAAGMNGDALKDFTTDRIGDKTLDEMRAAYENQYTGDVIDTTLAGMDRQRERERMAAEAAATAMGGKSNSRSAIGQAVSDQLYGMNRSEREALLREAGFNTAAELAQAEAALGQKEDQMNYDFMLGGMNWDKDMLGLQSDLLGQKGEFAGAGLNFNKDVMSDWLNKEMDWRQQGAEWDKGLLDSMLDREWSKIQGEEGAWGNLLGAEGDRQQMLSNLAGNWANLATQGASGLANFGQMERELAQQQANANWGHDQGMIDWLSGVLGQNKTVGTGESTSTKTEATPGFGQTLAGLATSAAGMWLSDENAKQDIEDYSGDALDQIVNLDVKEYSYRDDAPGHRDDRHQGLIAQDVERKIPGSTFTGPDGLKRIDPYAVSATIVKAVQELDAKQNRHRKWRKKEAA